MKNILLFAFLAFLISGCSSKKYFEPQKSNSYNQKKSLESQVKSFNKDIANLENNKFLTLDKISAKPFKEGFRVINANSDIAIGVDEKSNVAICQNEKCEIINLQAPVIAASTKDNLLAVIFWDNSIAIYDLKEKKFSFKESLKAPLACDNRIANPKFMTDLVLFPSLDGKVVVVNLTKFEKIRDILVDTDGQFNNVFFIEALDEMLIASTRNAIASLGAGNFEIKKYNISEAITDEKNIFIATIDGEIVSLDAKLNVKNSKKLKYAKIIGLAQKGDFLYALESQGYIIKIKKDFSSEEVFDAKISNSDKIFSNKNMIIVGDTSLING